MNLSSQSITLIKKHLSQSGDVALLIFSLSEAFSFQEWQFVMLEHEFDGKLVKRAYSIASTQREAREQWEIHFYVKKTEQPLFSHYLVTDIQIGDTLTMTWPLGHFIDNGSHSNYLFVSVWSWLWPILALKKKIIQQEQSYNKVFHLFGERYHHHTIQQCDELFLDCTNYSNVASHLYLSREKDHSRPNHYRAGYVQDSIHHAINFLGIDCKVFLCGLPAMVDDVRKQLIDAWIPKEHILFEKY